MFRNVIIVCLALSWVGCQQEQLPSVNTAADPYVLKLPAHFPAMKIPEDNPLTVEKVQLGKRLFFDPILSRNKQLSCASCHKPELAFTDNQPQAIGIDNQLLPRNSPTLANIGYAPSLLFEGGVPSLERQVVVPILAHNEFDISIDSLVARLSADITYRFQFENVFQRLPDLFTISRALAAYQRTLISGNARYDQAIQGKIRLTELENRGKMLFFSDRLGCSSCHSGILFTSYGFENNGIYTSTGGQSRSDITLNINDQGKLKIPTLRNIAVTGPYMHDGSLADLKAVITHYNRGEKRHPNQSPLIKPLHLTEEEQAALIAFLECLTDSSFISQKPF